MLLCGKERARLLIAGRVASFGGFRMSRFFARAVAISIFGVAPVVAAHAGPAGYEIFVLGAGHGMIMHLQSCSDIQCNSGDTCSCVEASGNAKVRIATGKNYIQGSYTLEVSVDNTATVNNGSGSECYGATGKYDLTLSGGILNMPFSGLACHVPGVKDGRTFGITAPVVIGSGTGNYANPLGTGSFSGSFSPTDHKVAFDIAGYATFRN